LCLRVSTSIWEGGFHFVPQKPHFVPLLKISCHKNTIVCHDLNFNKSFNYSFDFKIKKFKRFNLFYTTKKIKKPTKIKSK